MIKLEFVTGARVRKSLLKYPARKRKLNEQTNKQTKRKEKKRVIENKEEKKNCVVFGLKKEKKKFQEFSLAFVTND